MADPQKTKKATDDYQKLTTKLDTAVSQWSKLSEEIETLEASLN